VRVAVTREVSPAFDRCQLTHLDRHPIDVDLARRQHAAYEACLLELGCRLVRLPSDASMPDAVFVEDTCVVVDEVAVLTRPGAPSRRVETEAVGRALERHRKLVRIEEPGTLDGGDVLRLGRRLYVGRSGRSNPEGLAQLRALLAPAGYTVEGLELSGCLHLKSAVTRVGEALLLLNPAWVDRSAFEGWEVLEVDPAEPTAANALQVGDVVLHPAAHPRTRARLEQAGVRVVPVEVSEVQKAEGGVTCCSVIFDPPPA